MAMQPPATERNVAHWLSWAVEGYLAGRTEVDEFERAVGDALHGRYVNFDGTPQGEGEPFGATELRS